MPESHACAFEKPVIILNKGIKSENETPFSIIYPFAAHARAPKPLFCGMASELSLNGSKKSEPSN